MTTPTGQLITNLSHNKTAPKWSFQGRIGGGSRPSTPGPGAYNSRGDRGRCPAYGFGKSQRELARASSAPGPGQYAAQDRPRSAGPKYGFGSSQRAAAAHYNMTPGPGSYCPNFEATRKEMPKYTATPRRNGFARLNSTPGPGTYRSLTRPSSAKAPEWRFGSAGRNSRSNCPSPGPGAYATGDELGDKAPHYTMRARPGNSDGAANMCGQFQFTPGPGTYGGQFTQFGY
mmetsp:Transcript_10634/g.20611  ORF Transcript_10634/g.20611 Transcript_10634/m.20611 type:complete len:230 (-) Transcript_10634:77-766(-)